jgi:hypothetical protein
MGKIDDRMRQTLGRKTLAALGPTARQNQTAIFRSHTRTKPMATGANNTAGLKGAFHGLTPKFSYSGAFLNIFRTACQVLYSMP